MPLRRNKKAWHVAQAPLHSYVTGYSCWFTACSLWWIKRSEKRTKEVPRSVSLNNKYCK